ncbi:hypothetical protein NDU88_002942, partial [Pleurodeles waltl]
LGLLSGILTGQICSLKLPHAGHLCAASRLLMTVVYHVQPVPCAQWYGYIFTCNHPVTLTLAAAFLKRQTLAVHMGNPIYNEIT